MKRLLGAFLCGSAAFSTLMQALCQVATRPLTGGPYCSVPQPDGLIATIALTFGFWWFLLRKAPLTDVTSHRGTLPSKHRRLLVILVYTVATLLILVALFSLVISDECASFGQCTRQDDLLGVILLLLFLGAAASILTLGWRGQLPGARRLDHPVDSQH